MMKEKLHKEYKHIFSLIIIFLIASALMFVVHKTSVKNSSMLERYTFNNNKTNFTVYLKEREELVPYLILDSNYEDGILVLRKDLLPRKLSFNYSTPSEYFTGSLVDEFLKEEFLTRFDKSTLLSMKFIDISEKEDSVENRKAFILKMDSIDYDFGKEIGNKPMKYFIFNSEDKCPIKDCNGEYYVFSSTIISDNTGLKVLAVKNDDTMVSLNQSEEGFIRPAMIFDKSTKVEMIEDEKFGKILVLDFD